MTFFSKNAISQSLAAVGLLTLSSLSMAQSVAITHAKVHTATAQGVLNNAVVIIEDGIITAINPATINADTIIDAKGNTLTPGLIAPMNLLGLIEVSAVANTNDESDEKADITFDPSLAFNPKSSLIPYTRKGGITRAVIRPYGDKDIFAGQTSVVNLSGEFESITNADNAVSVELGSKSKGSRAFSLQTLMNKLDDADKKRKKAEKAKAEKKDKDKEKVDDPSREERILYALLDGQMPLVVSANRASDLLHLIALKQRFHLKMVINGAQEAILVADQLAKAEIPIIINPLQILPDSFDNLHGSLANPGLLAKAGVKVLFTEADTHNVYQLRFHAGNAIANGMSPTAALAALTVNVATAFNIDAGTIEVGKTADLVLWHGDMFELDSYVEHMWIGGKSYDTLSRQDSLRDRYMKKSDMPKAYLR